MTYLCMSLKEARPAISATTDLSKIMSYKGMIDKPVMIIYDSNDPEKFVLKEDVGTNYLALILLFIVGLVFIMLGVCNLVGYIKIN